MTPQKRRIIHNGRSQDGSFATRLRGDEPIRLGPPGTVLEGRFPQAG